MNSLAQSQRRAAIYVRVSTTGQEEDGTSLETQETACRGYAAERGHVVDEGHVYRDVHSGVELWERRELQRLREAIRRHSVEVVIAYAIDRLARDPVHLGVIITEAEHAGVDVLFVTEPLDNSPEGQLIRFVRGYAAKVEHEKIRERSLRGKRARVEAGKIHSHAGELYGYRRDKAAGVRVIYEPEAAVVRRIFRWVAEDGLSTRLIARRLYDEDIPSPAVGKRTYSDPARVPHWGRGVVRRILSEPAYKGETIVWRWKTIDPRRARILRPEQDWLKLPDGTTPAIVSPDLWDAVQSRLATNRGTRTRNEARPCLLRGLVICGMCSRRMRSIPEHGRRVYRCSSRETPSGPCGGKRVPAGDVEAWAWERVSAILRDPRLIAAEVERLRHGGPDSALAGQLEAARGLLGKLEKQQERLIRRFGASDDDSFPWELVDREISRLQQEKGQIQATIGQIEQRLAEQLATVEQLGALTAYCERVAKNLDGFGFDEKRLALEALAVQVVANGREWQLLGEVPLQDAGGVRPTTY